MQQVLWVETLLKLGGGLFLLVSPLAMLRLLGLPRTDGGFWPRLSGGLLIGMGAATFIEGWLPGSRGLGVAGCIVINFIGAALIAALLVLNPAVAARRGRVLLWGFVAALTLLGLIEIPYL